MCSKEGGKSGHKCKRGGGRAGGRHGDDMHRDSGGGDSKEKETKEVCERKKICAEIISSHPTRGATH